MLDVGGAVADEAIAMTDERAEGADVIGWAEGGREKAVGVELLDPLAVEDVGFLLELDLPGVDEADFEAVLFEDVDDRDPVDAGGLKGNGGDAALLKPVGEGVDIAGESGEDANGRVGSVPGDAGVDLVVADVEARGVEVDLLEGIEVRDTQDLRLLLLSHSKHLLRKEWDVR
jgi:hypothetical protein